MQEIGNFGEARKLLESYVPPPRSRRGVYTLERIKALMEYLGNPQDQYKVIHIAGTSGKTSTAYYVASILKAYGQKVGLTVSPHVDEINERIQVNLRPLAEKKFCRQLSKFIDIVGKSAIEPTYFELLVAFAYWQFALEKVDYAVIEVGLGGLLDGTNVVNRKDKVCVITDIGYDHVSVLGKTIEAIAAQKAGIIHAHNTVFSYQQDSEVMGVLREVASQQQAELHEILPRRNSDLPKALPLFQRRNWYLALNVCKYLATRDKLPELTPEQLAKAVQTYIPARMEIIKYKNKIVIMDGAHNEQKMQALVGSFRQMYPGKQAAVMMSLKRDKEYKAVLPVLLPVCSSLVITAYEASQDMAIKSMEPKILATAASRLGHKDIIIEPNLLVAWHRLLNLKDEILLITGSFYLLDQVRRVIFKHD